MPRCAGFPPWGRTSSLASGSGFEAAPMIDGLSLRMDDTAVVVTSPRPLTILSSAVHGGGFQSARTIIHLHVANPDPPAFVNAVMTATEVKTLALHEAGLRDAEGRPATGTSTDAVVIAATGRGGDIRFGGPASELGWSIAQAVYKALTAGIRS